MTAAEPVVEADVYVVYGDPDGHVHVYPDEYRAGLLALVYVGANLDGGIVPLSHAQWAAKRPEVEALLRREGVGRIVEHGHLAATELSAVEGECEGCAAPPGIECAEDCPLR